MKVSKQFPKERNKHKVKTHCSVLLLKRLIIRGERHLLELQKTKQQVMSINVDEKGMQSSLPPKSKKERQKLSKAQQLAQIQVKCTAIELLLSGATAGAISKTVIAPIDRIKILYQVNPSRSFTLQRGFKTFTTIVNNTGM